MAFDISGFTGAMTGDGARPNLFQVHMNFPRFVTRGDAAAIKGVFMIEAASLPESDLGTARTHYFGREVRFAGNRTYGAWRVNVINDEDFLLRDAFEDWFHYINSPEGNIRHVSASTLNGISGNGYGQNARVIQFGKTGLPLKEYNFYGMFPTNVSDVGLNWGSNDQIETFGVTLTYQYFVPGKPSGDILPLAATVLGEIL